MRVWAVRGAALGAGLAAAFAHPRLGLLPGLLGYAVLLWVLDDPGGARPLREAFFRSWLAGLGYFTVSTWWVADAFFVDARDQAWMAPFAVAFLAGGMALYWGLAGLAYRLLAPVGGGAARLLVFAGALAGAEWLRGHLFTGFPWDLPGESWRAGSAPSQFASVVGAYGMTWLTIAVAAAPGLGLRRRDSQVAIALAVLTLSGLYAFGAWRLANGVVTPSGVVVRVVQPDTPERATYDEAAFAEVLKRNLDLTRAPAARRPDVVIWSEAGLPAALQDYLAPGTGTEAAIAGALQPGQSLITGGFRAEPAPPGVYAPDGSAYFNSLVVLRRDPAGLTAVARYDKFRLVPFGEFLPLDRYLAPLGVHELIHVGNGFTPGPRPRPITPPGLPPVQPLICYESLFPGFTRDGARASGVRPSWIVNISDDAWFGPTNGPWQHLNNASYRAIEEGLPLVRATPTGVSAVIDPFGRVLPGKLLAEGAYGVIDAELPATQPPTVFESYGATGFSVMVALSGLAALQGRRATFRRNKVMRNSVR
jgi:apolipoprotein N-acyltransferase